MAYIGYQKDQPYSPADTEKLGIGAGAGGDFAMPAEKQDFKQVSNFWQDPLNVAKYYAISQSMDRPDWMNDEFDAFINQAYSSFEVANQGSDWTQWKKLRPDDPALSFLGSLAAPPEVAQVEQPSGVYPTGVAENANLARGGLSEAQWDALPWYQKALFGIFSSGRSAGASIGAVAGIPGGPVGMAAGAGIGAGLGAIGEKAPWLASAFDKLDIFAEGVERAMGTLSILTSGEIDAFSDIEAAWKAGHLTYDVARLTDKQIVDLTKPQEEVTWTDDELIMEAYQRIRSGEDVDKVYESIQERTGFSGQMRDLMGHMIFDPLNFVGAFAAKGIGGLAKAGVATGILSDAYKALGTAGDLSKGVPDLLKNYGATLRKSVPTETIKDMDVVSRALAGVDKAGNVSSLKAAQAPTGVLGAADKLGGAAVTGGLAAVVGAGVLGVPGAALFGLGGALFGGKRGLSYIANLTPASRANEINAMVVDNLIDVIGKAERDHGLTVKYIKQFANTDPELAAIISKNIIDAPDAAAVPLALKNIGPKLDAHYEIYERTGMQRNILENIVRAFGGDPEKDMSGVLKRLGDDKKLDVLFQQVKDAAVKTDNQDLLKAIDDGTFTVDELKNISKIFVKDKTAYTHEMWTAQLMSMLMDETGEWSAKWFDVKPDSSIIRISHALKNAQSLALLGLNPNYLVNNFVNNMVTMARDGVFGMRSQDAITNTWMRVGFEPTRLRQGVGAIGEIAGNTKISEAMKVGDKIDKFSDFTGNLTQKLGWMSNASAKMESWSSAQAMTSGFVKAWKKIWKPGSGYDRLPMELQTALGPDATNYVHNAIRRGMNKAEIEKALWSDYARKNVDDLIGDATRNMGVPDDAIRSLVDELDIGDYLRTRLGDNPSNDDVIKAFNDLETHINEQLDTLHKEHVKYSAEKIKAKLGVSGAADLVDWFAQDMVGMEYTELHHWRANEEIARIMDNPYLTPQQKNALWNSHYSAEGKRFGMWNKQSVSDLKAMTEALGTNDQLSSGLIYTKQEWNKNWRDFFSERQKLIKRVFKDDGMPGDLAFDEYERLALELYNKHAEKERNIELAMNGLIEQMIRQQFGDPAGDATIQWRTALLDMRKTMRDDMAKFREGLRGASHGERAIRWNEFIPQHKMRINDYYNSNFKQAPQGVSNMPLGYVDTMDDLPRFNVLEDWWAENKPVFSELRRLMLDPTTSHYGETLKSKTLNAATQAELKKYLGKVYLQMSESKNVAVKYAENARDMALLNYNRRRGFDTMLTTVMPYQFWYTRSGMNWAMRAMDNPGWLASWARIRAQQNKSEAQAGYPSRLEGKMQIEMPFLPDWMGDMIYADPLRQLFPHELLMQPFQRFADEGNQIDKRARYILEQYVADERYSAAEANAAYEAKSGAIWDEAIAQAIVEIDTEFNNPMDFLTAISGPLLPIGWAMNYAQGKPEKIGELPVTRAIQAITSFVKPGGINVEAPLRKALGLTVGGEYADYYIDRELTFMATMGLITPDEAMRAMVDRTGDAFTAARDRIGKTQAVRYFTSAFATDVFPEGEREIRALHEEFKAALDAGTVREFFDKHPEYETRGMSFAKTPEEKLRKYTISSIWEAWNELPDLTKKELKTQLGDDFNQSFMNSETRAYDAIDTDKLVAWARAMNAQLPEKAREYGQDLPGLNLPSPAQNELYQWYNDERERLFGNQIFDVNERYNALPKNSTQRSAFLKLHPELKQYWGWNSGIKEQYPEIRELQEMTADQIRPEFEVEIKDFHPLLRERLLGYFYAGQPMGQGTRQELYRIWVGYGKPTKYFDNFVEMLRSYFQP